MSDRNAWNGGDHADDPLAPEVVEDSIARSLLPDAPATPTAVLVQSLADAYALPPAAAAVLARSRATLARHAEALSARGRQMNLSDTDTWPAPARSITRPPQPPRRRLGPFEAFLRTVAAVLVIALLGAGFYALFHGMQSQGAQLQPTRTHTPISATATPTASPPQPPAPVGIYVTMEGTLLRIDPRTGAVEHTYPLALSSQVYIGTLVVANGVIYVTYQSTVSPPESGVVAVSATSGAQLWRATTPDVLRQLSLVDGVLYGGTVNNGGTTSLGPNTDTFYALRASDGHVLWTFPASTLRAYAVVTGGVVYLANEPQNTSVQHIHALRASDGSQLWDAPLPQDCGTGWVEAVDRGMTFAACSGYNLGPNSNGSQFSPGVYSLRASDGSMLWHRTTNGQPSVGATGAGLLYIILSNKGAAGALVALDETSGAVRWQVANGDGETVFDGATVYTEVASGSAFIAPSSSNLAAFSASDGALLWTYPETNQRVQSPPVIAGGVVYQILNEQVVAISAADGSTLWRSPALGSQHVGLDGLSVVTGG